jgi:hypothetical protein
MVCANPDAINVLSRRRDNPTEMSKIAVATAFIADLSSAQRRNAHTDMI